MNSLENFNQFKHPEIKKGEILLTNTTPDKVRLIGYKIKRVGIIAYEDNSNKKIEGMVPVFVSIKEYKEKQKETENFKN